MNTDDDDKREWYLRISNGVVFGPVPTRKLCQWAEQGRVQPENEVSEDRSSWIPVQEMPELDFNWFLEDADGNLTGPFNKRVAERLLSDGRVGAGASLLPRERADLSKLKRPAEPRRRHEPADDHPEFNLETPVESEAPAADSAAEEWAEEREDYRLQIEQLKSEKKAILNAAKKDKDALERSLAAERKKHEEALAEIEKCREEDLAERKSHEEALAAETAKIAEDTACREKKISDLKDELEASKRSLDASEQSRQKEAEDAKVAGEQAVKDACEPLLKRIAALEANLRETSSAVTEAQADSKTSEELIAAAVSPFKARIAALEGELEKAQEQIASAEQKHEQALSLAAKPLQARIAELEAEYEKVASTGREAMDAAIADATADLRKELAEKDLALKKAQSELENSAMMSDTVTARAAADAAEPLQEQVASLLSRLALAEKRADEAIAYRVETEKAVSNATAPLYVRIDELESEASATAERTRQAVEDATTDLRSQIEAFAAREKELVGQKEELERTLSEQAQGQEAGKQREEKFEAELAAARERADSMARECSVAKSNYSELLAFSNQRDNEANAQLAKAQATIDDLTARNEELEKKLEQQDKSRLVPTLAGMTDRDSKTLDRIVTSEREFLNGLRDEWQKQQRVVQERLSELARLHGGELAGTAKREARERAEQSEIARAKQMLDSLRHEYSEAMKRGEQRERELNQQIRKLETENDHAQDLAADSDGLRERVSQLSEMLHERDQTLAKERQDRSIERSRYEQAQLALSQQIANLQDGKSKLPFMKPPYEAKSEGREAEADTPERAAARKSFHVPPWMQLKK